MSERTFRSPSPSGRAKDAVSADANAPPVPAIPKDLSPASRHRRAVSEALPGQSKEVSHRASINFSRPISPRATPPSSPPPTKMGHSGWFTTPITSEQKPRQDVRSTAPIASRTSATGAAALGQSIQNAANAPVARKKKKKAPGVQGSRLSEASKPTGSAVPAKTLSVRTQSTPPPASVPNLPPSPQTPQSPQSSSLSDSSTESDGSGSRAKPPPLVRQPSTVMENPEIEEEAEKAEPQDPFTVSTVAPTKTNTVKQQRGQATNPASTQRVGRGADSDKLKPAPRQSTASERQSSLSPARSARFAPNAVDVSSGIRHQPPPRSLSPAKSALKHSPSSSIRTSSPVIFNAPGKETSDLSSDTGSNDGIKTTPRKKKGVRVSFDDNVVRDEDTPSSPGSPAGLESSRWSGRTLQGMDDDLDEIMKPRPALPFFGSIRRERRPVDEEVAEKVTETVPSMTNSTSTMVEPLGASGDHLVGGVLSRDFETKRVKSDNDPAAPEVTSVEGSGYMSDDTTSSFDSDEELGPTRNNKDSANKVVGDEASGLPVIFEKRDTEVSPTLELPDVPQIAVQPATPGTEGDNIEPEFEMPGAWSDRDEESADESLAATTASLASQDQPETTDDVQPVQARQSLEQYLENTKEDNSDDNSSVYSDAAEDLSELDGGFASLDAIVDSPIVPPSQEAQLAAVPESPLLDKKDRQPHRITEESYALPQQEMEREEGQKAGRREKHTKHKPSTDMAAPELEPAPTLKAAKPKKKKTKATVVPEPVAVAVERSHKPAPLPQAREAAQPKKPALRTSMRAEKPGTRQDESTVPSMRKPLRMSMRDGPTGFAASRNSETPAETREPKGTLQKRNIPLASATVVAAPHRRSASAATPAPSKRVSTMPALGRTFSNSSDASDSSFKRQRRASVSTTEGRYTMRRSMRSGPSPRPGAHVSAPTMRSGSPATAARSSRLSIRSLSPTGSFFSKRKPMSTSQDSLPPTMRMQGPPPSKSSKFSVGKAPSKASASPLRSGSSRFQSRYDDSSDEDEGDRLPKFRSRFADSDDEDDVPDISVGLRPVRGIPRRGGEEDGDSTELEDEESDAERPASRPQVSSKDIERAATNGNTNGAAAGLKSSLRDNESATGSPPRKEKRGFFGLGKKRRSSADVLAQTPQGAFSGTSPGSPSGKLQRRNSPGRRASESWPLPVAVPDEKASTASERPTTSDGAPAGPRLTKKQSTGGEIAESEPGGADDVFGRSGKKKKFPMLRKAFGLKD